ncbi:phosphoinositide phosphatase SAC6 isoform X1 [Cajanus cajan]|uniref:phosphoinositide phosphatase SAC6 isoform X1 n=1 Tax=Cajanus cajan TaxID=3821 RepID=UPI00098D821C|nr:phosphoinositide phosphatase SAC6 isoform X1 [Cajanus cajan]
MENPDSVQKLHTQMRLWEFPSQYVIEPIDGSSCSALAVSRKDGSTMLIDEIPECRTLRVPKIYTIYGVAGILRLLSGSYLVVITGRECVGSYLGHPIYKVSSLKVFPCDCSLNNTSTEQKKTEMEFSGILNVAEKTTGLFFSYDANLTLSVQRLNELGEESRLLPLWRQAEPRFLWNNYLLEVLIDNKLDPFLLPVVQGSFHHFQSAIGKDIIDITLIARRCTRRNGTRMWRRGADSDGYVANFVETEQIMKLNGYTGSFVQVRGSIPLPWEQIVNLTYKPKYELLKHEEAPRVLERHFLDLRKKYGAVLAVDLVNEHGGEGRLCEKFGSTVQNVANNDVRYVHFDFHHICGHVHFDRLSILYDQISDFIERNGYLLLNEKGEKMKEQLGVVRTNCIDCLDRTNVTQSMIGRNMLECQLRRLGVFGAEETICSHPNLDEKYKILWADHGDDISTQYTGTPALKGDFVRFGHRTIQGILNDGWNALMRYYLNNFCDGTKQDAIDLLQGHYIVSMNRDKPPSSQNQGLEAIISFPLAMGLVLTGFFSAIMSLRQVRFDFRHLFFSLIWASISVGIAAFVKANGRIFCNRPQLHKPRC